MAGLRAEDRLLGTRSQTRVAIPETGEELLTVVGVGKAVVIPETENPGDGKEKQIQWLHDNEEL